jgi:hypothetical protein
MSPLASDNELCKFKLELLSHALYTQRLKSTEGVGLLQWPIDEDDLLQLTAYERRR